MHLHPTLDFVVVVVFVFVVVVVGGGGGGVGVDRLAGQAVKIYD